MSRAHARMRVRLNQAGVFDGPPITFGTHWFRMLDRFGGSRRRANKALRMYMKRTHRIWMRVSDTYTPEG